MENLRMEAIKKLDGEVDGEYFLIKARILKRMWDALIEAGFNNDQATMIVAHQKFVLSPFEI